MARPHSLSYGNQTSDLPSRIPRLFQELKAQMKPSPRIPFQFAAS